MTYRLDLSRRLRRRDPRPGPLHTVPPHDQPRPPRDARDLLPAHPIIR